MLFQVIRTVGFVDVFKLMQFLNIQFELAFIIMSYSNFVKHTNFVNTALNVAWLNADCIWTIN